MNQISQKPTLTQHTVLAKGHRLVATARKIDSLAYLPDDNPGVLKLALDVSFKESVDAAVALALGKFGRLDVCVNNAGYSLYGDAENCPEDMMHEVMETNFWGTVRVTQQALRIMREENPKTGQQGGVIFNVTSMGGRIAVPGNSFYHASKWAVEGFSEAVSKEVKPDWNSKLSQYVPVSHTWLWQNNDFQEPYWSA